MRRAALFVGINDYREPLTPLAYAREDAERLYGYFSKSKSYDPKLVKFLSKDVTDIKLRREIDAILSRLQAGDLFLFYFSGHGVEDCGKHTLLSSEAQCLGGEWSGTLSIHQLRYLTQKQGVQSVFIIDSCRDSLFMGHKGTGIGAESAARSACLGAMKNETAVAGFLPPVILCSCSAGEQSFEIQSLRQGVFSRAFLEYLSEHSCESIDAMVQGLTEKIKRVLLHYRLSGKQTPELIKPLGCNPRLFDEVPDAEASEGAQVYAEEKPLNFWQWLAEVPPRFWKWCVAGLLVLGLFIPFLTPAVKLSEEQKALASAEVYASAAENTEKGIQLVQARRYTEALPILLAAESKNAEVLRSLGECYIYLDNPAKAHGYFLKAIERGSVKALWNLASFYQEETQDAEKAFEWFKKGAEQGNVDAQLKVAKCYRDGLLKVTPNPAEAFVWFEKAARQGSAEAQNILGTAYLDGNGRPKDVKKAVYWHQKAADQGHAWSQNSLGDCYYNGTGVNKDLYTAIMYYQKAAKQGDVHAQTNLAYCFEKFRRNADAKAWFEKAAEQGHAEAQFQLGLYYYHGLACDKNPTEAVKWFRKAAEQGNTDAQLWLGYCLRKGDGIERNDGMAAHFYRLAAEKGNAAAQNKLGVCYHDGEGVEQNVAEAFKWYQKAADQGDDWGLRNLGFLYLHGLGVEQNEGEALKWYTMAAEQGNPNIQFELAQIYYDKKDKPGGVEAVKWLQRVIHTTETDAEEIKWAQNMLGDCYRYERGVYKDEAKAFRWYQLSANAGDMWGQYNLAECYRNGIGTAKDEAAAREWYQKSADQGNEWAKKALQ